MAYGVPAAHPVTTVRIGTVLRGNDKLGDAVFNSLVWSCNWYS
ncbi:hypothetical protein [Kiloniella sp.]